MTVFYYIRRDGTFEHCYAGWLGDNIILNIDVSYWAVPGTLED
jgi:hypothetical protein